MTLNSSEIDGYLPKINFGTGKNNVLTLEKSNEDYDFSGKKDLINGNTAIDLNKNNLKTASSFENNSVKLDDGFIAESSQVSFKNGTIKIELADNDVSFEKGSSTEFDLDLGKFTGEDLTFESYAFLNVDAGSRKITVKSWDELTGDLEGDYLGYSGRYEIALTKYNGNTAIKNAFKNWNSKEIADGVKDTEFKDLGDYTFTANDKEYSSIISKEILRINSTGGAVDNMTFNTISANNIKIENSSESGNGNIIFNGTTVISGDIANTSSRDIVLTFNGGKSSEGTNKTEIGNIDSSSAEGSTTININNEFKAEDIIFNDKTGNKINISDSSDILGINKISGNAEIKIEDVGENSQGFNKILASAQKGIAEDSAVNSIEVKNKADVDINTDYSGGLTFNSNENIINIFRTNNYNGEITAKDNNKITIGSDDCLTSFGGKLNLGKENTVNIKNSELKGMEVSLNGTGNVAEIENSEINGVKFTADNGINISLYNNVFEGKVKEEKGIYSVEGGLVLGSGDDRVEWSSSVKDNEIFIDGGAGEDVFAITEKTNALSEENPYEDYSVLSGAVINFENINVERDIKFDSGLELAGTNNINISSDKNLVLGIDYSMTKEGKVIGHALYDKGITVNNENGKLIIETAKADKNYTVSLGDENKSIINSSENIFLSSSSVHHVEWDGENGEINIILNEHIIGDEASGGEVKYSHLDKIYQSIADAGKISQMEKSTSLIDKTKEQSIRAQLEFYGKIYNSTPYAYSNDVSRKTAELINDSIMESSFKADEKEWIFYGAIAVMGFDDSNSYYGRGYYQNADIGKSEVDVESDIYGAYFVGEYGYNKNLSLGYVVAGNRSSTDIGGSSLKGAGYYLGAYAKYDVNNSLRFTAGAGYQHNYYEADRNVSNDYQSMNVEKDYTDDTLTAYIGAKYIYRVNDTVTFEPKANVNIVHVMQDDITEKDKGDLSISVDGENFTSATSEIGADIVKKINLDKGTLRLRAGIGAEIALSGYDKEELTARINGSSKDFEIISEEDERVKAKFTIGAEFETESGIFYNARANYLKHSEEEEINAEFGIGYKF